MKIKMLFLALVSVAAAGTARAELISGWDGSQFGGSGTLAVDFTFANTYAVDSQFSDRDFAANPISGLGAGGTAYNNGTGSGAFGRMYFDGSFGSTDTTGTLDYRPVSGSLTSNQAAPSLATDMSEVGTANSLIAEGQSFGADLKMAAVANVDVVFSGTLNAAQPPYQGRDWFISLGGNTTGSAIDVDVEFSTDGLSYSLIDTFTLNAIDSAFTSAIAGVTSDSGFFRLGLTSGAQIDNIAVFATAVPEPGTALLFAIGLAGLARSGRRRH